MNDFKQLDNFFTNPPERKKRESFLPTKEQFYYLPQVLSKNERYAIIALLLVATISLIATPVSVYYHGTVEGPAYGGAWSEAIVGTPVHINPLLLQANDADSDIVSVMYAGLLRYGTNAKLVPNLAESYTISDDGLRYTFKLKPHLTWHDGEPLTSEDVAFTILTAQNADYASTQRLNWQGVEVETPDHFTITFTLKNRYAQFIGNTTLGILPKHVWENVKASNFALSENNVKPIGAGPYAFSKIRRDERGGIGSMEVTAFDGYAGGKPFIDHLTFRFYESEQGAIEAYNRGDVEGLGFVSSEYLDSLRSKNSLAIHRLRLPRYFALFFNQNKSKALSDKQVRFALHHATDRQAILDTVLHGTGTTVENPFLPGIIDIPDTAMKYPPDQEKARQLLDSAGWKILPDGIRMKDNEKLEVEITTSEWPELQAVAQELQRQWNTLGIMISIKTLSIPDVQQAIKDRDYQALLFGEVLGLDPDPFSFWHSSQKKDPGLNLALYDNSEADKLLENGRQTMDALKRRDQYEQLQKIISADAPALFLYSPDYLYVQPKKIKNNLLNIIATPANRFDTVHEWYIDTKRKKE